MSVTRSTLFYVEVSDCVTWDSDGQSCKSGNDEVSEFHGDLSEFHDDELRRRNGEGGGVILTAIPSTRGKAFLYLETRDLRKSRGEEWLHPARLSFLGGKRADTDSRSSPIPIRRHLPPHSQRFTSLAMLPSTLATRRSFESS